MPFKLTLIITAVLTGVLILGMSFFSGSPNGFLAFIFSFFILVLFFITFYSQKKKGEEKVYQIFGGLALMALSRILIYIINDFSSFNFFKMKPSTQEDVKNFLLVFGSGVGANIFTSGITQSKRDQK